MSVGKQGSSKSLPPRPTDHGEVYEIKIKGILDDHWKQWFEGMTLDYVPNGETGHECTLITGPIADQPALHGLLAKIRDLNLTLISFRKISPKCLEDLGGDQHCGQKNLPPITEDK